VRDTGQRLSAAEEDLLLARVAYGNQSARDRLVLAHRGLVAAIAARHAKGSGRSYEELVQEGMTGLLVAIDRFDRTRGTRLSTYATYYIEGAIKRVLDEPPPEDATDMDTFGVFDAKDLDDDDEEEEEEEEEELTLPEGSLTSKPSSRPVARSHKRGGAASGSNERAAALAAIIAHAVEYGSLDEQLYYARLARRKVTPNNGPGFGEIRAFRERYLAGGLIAQGKLASWIARQASAEGEPAWAYLRVPLGQDDLGELGELPLAESRQAYAAWLAAEAERVRADPSAELPARYAGGACVLRYRAPGDRAPQRRRIRGDGVLAELQAIAAGLCGHFDAWTVEEAVSFVVCGLVPPFARVRARSRASRLYPAAARITLDVDPRSGPREVAELYSALRARHLVGRERTMSARNLALAVFVECHWHPRSSWAKLLVAWNEAHPPGDALHWKGDARRFKVDCQRAWQGLTGALWPGGPSAAKRLSKQRARADQRRQEAKAALWGAQGIE
jgi:RNA polymerase sigma factor (sigma-70 family)